MSQPDQSASPSSPPTIDDPARPPSEPLQPPTLFTVAQDDLSGVIRPEPAGDLEKNVKSPGGEWLLESV